MPLSVEEIVGLLETRGTEKYGREAVSQLEHALQCAQHAERAGEPPEVVAACLLHDLGHLLTELPDELTHTQDDVHQYLALPFLRGVFADAVLDPIRLHVDAKRYLCAAQPGYWDTLSQASKDSLVLQGGPHTIEQAAAFIAQDHAPAAVRLRRYDDLAKTPGQATPPLEHYAQLLRSLAQPAFAQTQFA
jgi:phosphonate degradation associated HDIG domain protein